MKLDIETDEQFQKMLDQLTEKTAIEMISIDNFEREITTGRFEDFAQLLCTDKAVKKLKITHFPLRTDYLQMLAYALNLNITLESLLLDSCNISLKGIQLFVKMISSSRLQQLSIKQENLQDTAISYLTQDLNIKFPLLTDLNLFPIMSTQEIDGIRHRPYQELTSSYMNTAKHIAHMLEKNTSLTQLSLKLFNNAYQGIETIIAALSKNNKSLQKLIIKGCDEKKHNISFDLLEQTPWLALKELGISISLISQRAIPDNKKHKFEKNIEYSKQYKKLFLKTVQLYLIIQCPQVLIKIILDYLDAPFCEPFYPKKETSQVQLSTSTQTLCQASSQSAVTQPIPTEQLSARA